MDRADYHRNYYHDKVKTTKKQFNVTIPLVEGKALLALIEEWKQSTGKTFSELVIEALTAYFST